MARAWTRIIFDRYAAVRLANGQVVHSQLELDEAKHELKLTSAVQWVFTYTRPSPARIELDGSLAGNSVPTHHVHLVLVARDGETVPLLARGFHWVQEFPFNR